MACPFFRPAERLVTVAVPARAPLGALFAGLCEADEQLPHAPPLEVLSEVCNFGYGRSRCAQFPQGAAPDAVRFSYRRGELIYILEYNHVPERFGAVVDGQGLIASQARAFASAYPVFNPLPDPNLPDGAH